MVSSRSQSKAQTKAQSRAQDRVAAAHTAARSGSKRAAPAPEDGRDVYRELISEAAPSDSVPERPLKKPRLGRARRTDPRGAGGTSHSRVELASDRAFSDGHDETGRPQQTAIDSDESEDEDLDWEEVGFDRVEPQTPAITSSKEDDEFGDISLEISTKAPKRAVAKRKPATTAEKLLRLQTHEAHLLFLLFHVHVRNSWCNLPQVQDKLKTTLPADVISLLNPDQSLIQFGRSEQFLTGLKKAVLIWRAKFKVTASGMRCPHWAESSEGIQEQIKAIQSEFLPETKQDFAKAAVSFSGSQDVGNQLFCALLRRVGVEARLVCSLQALPFGASLSKTTTPRKGKATIYLDGEASNTSAGEGSAGSASEGSSTSRTRIMAPGRRRRIGQPNLGAGPSAPRSPASAAKRKRPVQTLDYPVFWVEAFNAAYQKWVPVDAIVTGTVAKPSKLEPPGSYEQNSMTYVVALEEDSVARDVTRRYAKAYNAKTRKLRVESNETGAKWWRKALKVFRRTGHLDRDQVEDAELGKKEASEGFPNNVQDFKDHPYYALERHLKRHEVIWPKREVGKINAGKNNLEPVYRRNDVQVVRSADKWYRFGREIKPGEQPLKHVPGRKSRAQDFDDADAEEPAETALYAFSQTLLYVPPPVVRGRIPKNAYGNLDVYVPSMVPPGAYHVRHSLAQRAARLIGIDYADAVTGFQFKGRHGTAVTAGVVVADEYREAVEVAIEGFEYAQENEEAQMHSLGCLKLWRRFLTGLRIRERLSEYKTGSPADGKIETIKEKMDEADEEPDEVMEAGGFFPEPDQVAAVPTASRFTVHDQHEDEDVAEVGPRLRRQRNLTVESDPESEDEEEEYMPSLRKPPVRRRRRIIQGSSPETDQYESGGQDNKEGSGALSVADQDSENGGGFLADADVDADHSGGGFLPDEHDMEHSGGFLPDAQDLEGGFMPEDEEDDAGNLAGGFTPKTKQNEDGSGGFTVEDGEPQTPPIEPSAENPSSVEPEARRTVDDAEVSGGGFVVEDKPVEQDTDALAETNTTPVEVPLSTGHDADEYIEPQNQDSDEKDDEDRGSLLSHDPEDEDAEPEWLNSD